MSDDNRQKYMQRVALLVEEIQQLQGEVGDLRRGVNGRDAEEERIDRAAVCLFRASENLKALGELVYFRDLPATQIDREKQRMVAAAVRKRLDAAHLEEWKKRRAIMLKDEADHVTAVPFWIERERKAARQRVNTAGGWLGALALVLALTGSMKKASDDE